jgi:hypothetical protein
MTTDNRIGATEKTAFGSLNLALLPLTPVDKNDRSTELGTPTLQLVFT